VIDALRELAASLLRNKIRTLSTVAGITWGTLAVVLMLSFGFAMEQQMRLRSAGLGKGIVIAWPSATTMAHAGLGEGRPIRLTPDDVRVLQQKVAQIEAITPEMVNTATLRRGDRLMRAQIAGVDPAYAMLRSMRPLHGGRFLGPLDRDRRVAFLGHRLARDLFGSEDCVGRSLQMHDAPFTVIGVLAPKEQDGNYGDEDEYRICIPIDVHERLFGRRFVSNFVFRAHDPSQHDAAIDGIYGALSRSHRFDPSDRQTVRLWDLTEHERMLGQVYFGFDLLLGLSGVLTLLVGGVGVGNLMFVLVRRRRREFGLLLALGALPRQILVEVLVQTGALVALGGLLGLGLAWVIAVAVRSNPDLAQAIGRPEISAPLAISVVALLGTVALLAGLFPARRAANLDPVEALRG